MELIIGFANLDRSVFEAYLQYGIMKQVTIIYNTDDLLVKLNVIEIVQYMGDTQWCAEFLLQQQFFKELISGATVFFKTSSRRMRTKNSTCESTRCSFSAN
jgi:hypothetical protein